MSQTFTQRMLGAAKLEPNTYEEVEADHSALPQALGVVILASVATGIGSAVTMGAAAIIVGIIVAIIGWLVWAGLTYIIGTKLLPEAQTRSDMGELLRTIGFSSSPGILRIFGLIPGLGPIIYFITGIWMLMAMVVAVRQALDYKSTWRAVGVCLIGWIIQIVIVWVIFTLFGPGPGGESGGTLPGTLGGGAHV
jgi:hypothetical protein